MVSKKPLSASSAFNKNLGTQAKNQTKIINTKKKATKIDSLTNLEAFACLWLDSDIANTQDNRETEQNLRQIINHLRTFNSANECEQLIRTIKKEKVILIISGQLGHEVIPRVHDLPQLIACYIYCLNESEHQGWAKEYSKVCSNSVFILQS